MAPGSPRATLSARRPPAVVCPIGFQPISGTASGTRAAHRWAMALSAGGKPARKKREPEVTTGADVAQLVEQLTRNEQVVRSSRIVGSIFLL